MFVVGGASLVASQNIDKIENPWLLWGILIVIATLFMWLIIESRKE